MSELPSTGEADPGHADPPGPESLEAPPDLGILFVHGLSDDKRGQNLTEPGGAIYRWLLGWLNKKGYDDPARPSLNRVYLDNTRLSTTIPSDGDAPAYSELIFQASTDHDRPVPDSRWILAESWWAPTFPHASYSDFANWAFNVVPWLISHNTSPLLGRIMAAMHRTRDVLTMTAAGDRGGRAAAQLLRVVVFIFTWLLGLGELVLLGTTLSVVQIGLVALTLLAFIPQIGSLIQNIQQSLASVFGEAYLLTRSPLSHSAAVSQVRRDVRWLQRMNCRRVAIIAHSGGAYVSYHALVDPQTNPGGLGVDLFITYGSGLKKMEAADRVTRSRPDGFMYGFIFRVLALGCVLLFGPFGSVLNLALALWLLGGTLMFRAYLHSRGARPPALPAAQPQWLDFYAVADIVADGRFKLAGPRQGPGRLILALRGLGIMAFLVAAIWPLVFGNDPGTLALTGLGLSCWIIALIPAYLTSLRAGTEDFPAGKRSYLDFVVKFGRQTSILPQAGSASRESAPESRSLFSKGQQPGSKQGAKSWGSGAPVAGPLVAAAGINLRSYPTLYEVDNLDSLIGDHSGYWHNDEQYVAQVVRACAQVAWADTPPPAPHAEWLIGVEDRRALTAACIRRQNRVFCYLMSGLLAILVALVLGVELVPRLYAFLNPIWSWLVGWLPLPFRLPAEAPGWFGVGLGLAVVGLGVAYFQQTALFLLWRDWGAEENRAMHDAQHHLRRDFGFKFLGTVLILPGIGSVLALLPFVDRGLAARLMGENALLFGEPWKWLVPVFALFVFGLSGVLLWAGALLLHASREQLVRAAQRLHVEPLPELSAPAAKPVGARGAGGASRQGREPVAATPPAQTDEPALAPALGAESPGLE